MPEKTLPKFDGHFAPTPQLKTELAQRYSVKYGYYFFSGFLILVGTVTVLFLYDLSRDGIYPGGIVVDGTILRFYLLYLFVIGLALRARAGVCVLCGHYKFPVLGIDSYCSRCGAHLFRYAVFQRQEMAKAARDLNPGERLLAMSARGETDAVHNLIGKGVDIDFTDSFGNTALMNAAKGNHMDTLNLLLMAAADPFKKNNYGLNALILAVDRGQVDAAKRLLDSGIGVNEQTNDGRTALDIAKNQKHEELIQILSGYPG